jgi:transposase-like protein
MEVQSIQIFTRLLDGEYPLKCGCGQITRTTLRSSSLDFPGRAFCGPHQLCPACGRGFTKETTTPVSEEEYKVARR